MFSSFISAFCIGCVVLGVLSVLIPDGKLSKTVSYAFSLSFLCVILSAAVVFGKMSMPDIDTQSHDFNNERLSAASAQMVFSEALARENINFSKIRVFTDKSETGGINISKVFVYTAESPEKIRSAISSDSYEVVVINE